MFTKVLGLLLQISKMGWVSADYVCEFFGENSHEALSFFILSGCVTFDDGNFILTNRGKEAVSMVGEIMKEFSNDN